MRPSGNTASSSLVLVFVFCLALLLLFYPFFFLLCRIFSFVCVDSLRLFLGVLLSFFSLLTADNFFLFVCFLLSRIFFPRFLARELSVLEQNCDSRLPFTFVCLVGWFTPQPPLIFPRELSTLILICTFRFSPLLLFVRVLRFFFLPLFFLTDLRVYFFFF